LRRKRGLPVVVREFKEVEQAACTFLLPFARELGRSGMEALVLSTTHSSAKHLCLEDCTDIVMRAKRSHLHSLLICLSAESSSCAFIDADAHATGTHADEHRLFPIGQSTSATRDLPIFEVHLNAHGPQRLHGERKTASLEWRPLHVGGNSAEGHSLTRGNITECIEAVMDSGEGRGREGWGTAPPPPPPPPTSNGEALSLLGT